MEAFWFRFMGLCMRLGIEVPSPRAMPTGVELVRLVALLSRVESRVWRRMCRRPRSIEEARAIDDQYEWVDINHTGEAPLVERRQRVARDRFWSHTTGYVGAKIDPRPFAKELGNLTTHEEVIEAQAGQEALRRDEQRRQRERDANRVKYERAKRARGERAKGSKG